MPDYEHAGTWTCEGCGEEFEVESKLDVFTHTLACGISTGGKDQADGRSRSGGHEGYRRRKRELRQYSNAASAVAGGGENGV